MGEARKPFTGTMVYNKYGFVRIQVMTTYCPACRKQLNAGPNYMPKCCSECGQKLDWEGIEWKEDKCLGFVERAW